MSFQPCVLFRSQACQLQSQYQSTQNILYFVTALNCVLTQWALYSVRCTLYLRVVSIIIISPQINKRKTLSSSPHPRAQVSKDE